MSPRTLYIDIETSPIIAAVWKLYDDNAIWVESDTFLLSFAAKWEGEKTKVYGLPDYHGHRKFTDKDDKGLCKKLHEYLDEAEVVIAHNGDAFDIKKINSRMKVHKLRPYSPIQTIDSLKIAKKYFKFDSNKLDNLGRYLDVGRKIPNTGAALWRACRDGDKKSWKKMLAYNVHDVDLLVRVYSELKAWDTSAAVNRLYADKLICPACKSRNIHRRGPVRKSKTKFQFECQVCGNWSVKVINPEAACHGRDRRRS